MPNFGHPFMTSTKNQVFDSPLSTWAGPPPPLWTSTRGRHEIGRVTFLQCARNITIRYLVIPQTIGIKAMGQFHAVTE